MTVQRQSTEAYLDDLFTMCFNVDEDLIVSRSSDKLKNLLPDIDSSNFLDFFDCHRPTGIKSYDDLLKHEKDLFLLVSRDRRLALRSQFVPLFDSNSIRFVGAPWLAWMNDHNPRLSLQLTDFPKLDAQMDQQFYLASQQNMVNDLEKINGDLLAAKEEALEANRIRTDLFAVMSHEMRTPLNGVISALTLIEDQRTPDSNQKLMRMARNSANSLMTVINFTLDYAKIDAGKMQLVEESFDPRKLLLGVEAIARSLLEEKPIRVSLEIDDSLPTGLLGDEEKLRQVLTNLVGNAVKYTSEGNIWLKLKWISGGQLEFSVKDTGVGIAHANLDNIFSPFWTSSSGNEHLQSTGLGLNISKQLTELMGGSLYVQSELNIGSEFIVLIPIKAIELEQGEVRETNALQEVRFSGRVLVVDDNLTNLALAEMLLEKLGLQIRKASTGEDAVSIARDVTFDVVLMDILMPGMDGMQTMKQINKLPDSPPIIACTANVGPDYARQYVASGFSGYVQKPIELHQLCEVLAKWLPKAEVTEERQPVKPSHTLTRSVLEKLCNEIGEEKYERIRDLFLKESQKRMTSLLSAWVSRDYDKLVLESHAMAGSAGSFGADILSQKLKRIEYLGREREVNLLIEEISGIDRFFDETIQAIEEYVPGDRS